MMFNPQNAKAMIETMKDAQYVLDNDFLYTEKVVSEAIDFVVKNA